MEQNPKSSKILYTVLAVLLAVSVLPVAVIGWLLVPLTRDTLRGNEQTFQINSVVDKAKQIKLYVNAYHDQIGAFARSLEIAGGVMALEQSSSRDKKVGMAVQSDSNLCGLIITPLDPAKADLASYATASAKISSDEFRPLLTEALDFMKNNPKHEHFVGKPLLLKSTSISAIVLAAPVMNGDPDLKNETIEGMVMAVVSLDPVFNFVTQTTGGLQETNALLKSGQKIFFVVDDTGRIIAHPDQQVVFSDTNARDLKIVDEWMHFRNNVTGAVSFDMQDNTGKKISMLGTYTTADIASNESLGVIAMVNEDAAYPSVGQMINKTILVSVITILVALGVGFILAIRLTSPIETLALGARAIATGDFTRRIRVRTRNEIGQLSDDFNKMADHIQQYINELRRAAEENRMLFIGTVRALAEAIDGKDTYTRGHSERVMKYSVLIAQYMNLSDDEIEDIRIAGILHDVGKIGIDDKILKKPAALTDDEYRIMKQHPQIGAKIMSEIPQMKRYIPGMFYHHECLDGKGYPLGLRGDQIPMMARIISVADVFDAMTTNRPYQRAMDTEVAVERIRSFVGTRYDGQVVEALVGALHSGKLDEVIQSYAASIANA